MGRTRARRGAVVMLAAVCVLGLWSLSRAGTALVVLHSVESPDAIVALASHEWERLPAAAALAHEYPSSTVLLTVPLVITDRNCHRCSERDHWLTDLGVAPERIREIREGGHGTRDEALTIRRYAEQHALRRLAIVTSPYHTRRALATFQTVFEGLAIEVGIYPASGASHARPATWWAHEYDRAYVAYEWAATLYYWFEFRVPLAATGTEPQTKRTPMSRNHGKADAFAR